MKKFTMFIVIVFLLSFLLELILEELGKVDSIGLWYTGLVALVYTVGLSIVAAFVLGVQRLFKKHSGPDHG